MASGLTLRETPTAKPKVSDDPIALALLDAFRHYERGNFKAAMHHGATGLNLLAAAHDINGGGWE